MDSRKDAISIVKKIMVSMLVASIIVGVLLLFTSYLISKSFIGENQVQIVLLVIHGVAAFVSGIMIGKIQKERKFMWGMVAGVAWFLFVLILSFALQSTGIDTKELGGVLFVSLIGGLLGGMLA
ncbi:MAG: TIGR04086 family membrane protein [Lachnospiraceae bacterium]